MSSPKKRYVTDPAALKALAHPLRMRLYHVLTVDGPATASLLSKRLEEPVGLLSYHLTQLARFDFIVEVPELAKDGRERWWQATGSFSWRRADFAGDPAGLAAAEAASDVFLGQLVDRMQNFRAERDSLPEEWADAALASNNWFKLTPGELRELTADLNRVFGKWKLRAAPDDGRERGDVFAFFWAGPSRP
ncbi:winged helix-turn-helix domain-containing protein [Flindersiella endophytica]